MEILTKDILEEIQAAYRPDIAIHVIVFDKYKETSYDNLQNWIRKNIEEWRWTDYHIIKDYLINAIKKNDTFEPYKEQLLVITMALNYGKLEYWVDEMSRKGFTKKSIFEILSELFVFVQYNPLTGNNETYDDFVADFLDGFTALGKNNRILPNEPDC